MDDLAEAVASAVGAIVTVVVTYPVEIVKNKMASAGKAQSGHSDSASFGGIVSTMYRKGGPMAFYDGMGTSAIKNAVEKFIYFYAYSTYRRLIMAMRGQKPTMVWDLVAGTLSEFTHLPVTAPMETVLIKVVNDPTKGPLTVINEVGLINLYGGGMWASCLLGIKPAIQMAIFEAMKLRLLAGAPANKVEAVAAALSAGQAFALGAIARAIATQITYPYTRAKFMFMAMSKGDDSMKGHNPIVGIHIVLIRMFNEMGIGSLYQGLIQELVRSMMSAALLMAIRERLSYAIKVAIKGK